MRWPAMSKLDDKVEGVSWDAQQSGLGFQRPISLWRTGHLSHLFRTLSIDRFRAEKLCFRYRE